MIFGYRVLNFEVTDGSAGPVYVLERSTMTNGGQDPRVVGSVEKASSQFESTTVGKFEILEEISGAGPSIKNIYNNSNNSKFLYLA